MARQKLLNRKQKYDESPEHVWHALNGHAANCDFGTQPPLNLWYLCIKYEKYRGTKKPFH